jgi:hypothetical protein
MLVDTIKKTHPKGILNGSLGTLISAIDLVAVHVPTKTRDLLSSTWMSDKSRLVKTKQITKDLVNRSVVFSSNLKGGIEPAPASI